MQLVQNIVATLFFVYPTFYFLFRHTIFQGGELLICAYTSQSGVCGVEWGHICNKFSTRCRTAACAPPLMLVSSLVWYQA
jgi:hypothetical protein